jgi:hypothetical protein
MFRQARNCSESKLNFIRAAEAATRNIPATALEILRKEFTPAQVLARYPILRQKLVTYQNDFVADLAGWYLGTEAAFEAMKAAFTQNSYDVECECHCLEQPHGVLAYTYPPARVVHFCPAFFKTSEGNRAGTFLHELSHITSDTYDFVQKGGPPYWRVPYDAHWYDGFPDNGPRNMFQQVMNRMFFYPN